MIDILYNKLGDIPDISMSEWDNVDPTIFIKHSQHSQKVSNEQKKVNIKESAPIIVKKGDIVSIVEDTKSECVIVQQSANHIQQLSKKKTSKDTTIKPLGIIINETMSFNNSTEYIKEKLITLISKEEFTKVFGLTKCAEIMSGIVNNRWNKSTALFISFLLDKEVYYNENIVLYNKEKNKGRITI